MKSYPVLILCFYRCALLAMCPHLNRLYSQPTAVRRVLRRNSLGSAVWNWNCFMQ